MKAIFSNWSKPQEDNEHAGYSSLEDFKIGISTAVLCAARFYECHFVGDAYSCNIIKQLNLPFKTIQEVDFAATAPEGLWNYSKLKACSMFEAPFVHLDNDVFLLKKLPEFEDYLFQSLESFTNHPWYDEPIQNMRRLFVDPAIFRPDYQEAYNCGIIGIGKNKLIKEWILPSLSLIETEQFKILYKARPAFYEIVVEQYTAVCAAKRHYRDVKFLLRNDFIQEDAVTHGFVHMISRSKRNVNKMQKIKDFYNRNFKNK
jgi:hypothetical protein